jgi:hypothetical protein
MGKCHTASISIFSLKSCTEEICVRKVNAKTQDLSPDTLQLPQRLAYTHLYAFRGFVCECSASSLPCRQHGTFVTCPATMFKSLYGLWTPSAAAAMRTEPKHRKGEHDPSCECSIVACKQSGGLWTPSLNLLLCIRVPLCGFMSLTLSMLHTTYVALKHWPFWSRVIL